MQFTTVALSALSVAGALAQTTVHVVKVGNSNGTLAYSPNTVKAAVGDMVQFQFAPANHTVTQSTFDQPCQPIANNAANSTGIFSGFMPVKATDTSSPTYTVQINNTTPIWLYCSQAKHCQSGMVMVINENPTANASRTLANFQALAKQATANLAPGTVEGGVSGSNSTSSSGSSGTSSGTTSSSSAAATASAGMAVRPSEAFSLAGLLAMGLALFL